MVYGRTVSDTLDRRSFSRTYEVEVVGARLATHEGFGSRKKLCAVSHESIPHDGVLDREIVDDGIPYEPRVAGEWDTEGVAWLEADIPA